MGYVQCVTEANLALTEMVRIGVDTRTVCWLPLILDGACGLKAMQITKADLTALGVRLFVDPVTPLLVLHQTLRQSYQAIARGEPAAPFGSDTVKDEHKALHATIDLEALLAIERATVEQ